MNLVDSNDPILKQPCEKFNFLAPQIDLREFADDLIKTMLSSNGIGLAANQVGVPLQIFALASEPPILVINPRILEYSKETIELEEGCLSFPGQLVKVKRPIWIRARFNLVGGNAQTFRFEGMTARVFQHEYDHIMEGKTMYDRLSKLKRDMYLKKKMKKVKL